MVSGEAGCRNAEGLQRGKELVKARQHGVRRSYRVTSDALGKVRQIRNPGRAILSVSVASCRSATAFTRLSPSPGPGARATLRYGHFVAGALERLAGAAILHGEALAVGMEAEMKISQSLGWADEETAKAQNRLIKALGLPTRAKGVPADRLSAPLLAAKLPGLDLPDELGHARGPAPLTQELVRAAVAAVTK